MSIEANDIAVFTNLKAIAWEIAAGSGTGYQTIVAFIKEIDIAIGDSEFTDQLKAMVSEL